jgi:hypothetical protein
MLYDKRWEAPEIKADPLTMESLVAWLEKQPARARYDYEDCSGKCLYGLYMASHGVAWEVSGGCSSLDSGPERAEFCINVYSDVACERPWTFGAALKRARKALAA